MHPLSFIVTGLLVTSGAATALLGGNDLGIPPLHFGGQDPDTGAGENETGNETGNQTDGNQTAEEPSGNDTAEPDSANATADNATHEHEFCDEHNYTDCTVSIYDSDDVFLEGSGDWTFEVTEEMRYLSIHVWADSFGVPGLGDSVDIVVLDPLGNVVAEVHHDGGLGSFSGRAYIDIDLDRSEDEFLSGVWSIELDMTTAYGSYDVWVEGSCNEYYWW